MSDESAEKSIARIHDVCMAHVAMRLMRLRVRRSPTGTAYLVMKIEADDD
jgi:hypothetical protein